MSPEASVESVQQRRRAVWASNLRAALEAGAGRPRRPGTPKELHQALADRGVRVSRQAVYLWLSGDSAPTLDHQAALAQVCGVTHHRLFPVEVDDEATGHGSSNGSPPASGLARV